MAYHSRLSPSDSATWINCPGSIALRESLGLGDDDTSWSEEGTIAHALGELKAALAFGKIELPKYRRLRAAWKMKHRDVVTDEIEAEMDEHTDAYVELLASFMHEMGPGTSIFLEIRVSPAIVPGDDDGTADAILVNRSEVRAVDFKYGKGVEVIAKGNTQLRIYGVGAYEMFKDLTNFETLSYTVFQPRIDNHVLTETLSLAEALEWRDSVIPIAQEALAGSDRFGPSDKACRWCEASGRCPAQMQDIFSDPLEAIEPRAMTPEETAAALNRVPFIRRWLTDLEEAALTDLYQSKRQIPGWKVVMSGGIRKVTDDDKVIEVLEAEGYEKTQIVKTTEKVRGIGELEKLLGKPKFRSLLEATGLVQKSDGRPSLAPEDDNRSSATPNSEAANVFGAVEGDTP